MIHFCISDHQLSDQGHHCFWSHLQIGDLCKIIGGFATSWATDKLHQPQPQQQLAMSYSKLERKQPVTQFSVGRRWKKIQLRGDF